MLNQFGNPHIQQVFFHQSPKVIHHHDGLRHFPIENGHVPSLVEVDSLFTVNFPKGYREVILRVTENHGTRKVTFRIHFRRDHEGMHLLYAEPVGNCAVEGLYYFKGEFKRMFEADDLPVFSPIEFDTIEYLLEQGLVYQGRHPLNNLPMFE